LLDEASGMPALKTQLHKNLQVQENLQGTEIIDTLISKKISFEDTDELIGISNVSYLGTELIIDVPIQHSYTVQAKDDF
jgi:hypothetical protein